MRTTRLITTLLLTGLLAGVAASPTLADDPVGRARGTVVWQAKNWPTLFPESPIGTSTFQVRDGRPGRASKKGDRGTYTLVRPEPGGGSLTIDVTCARVDPGGVAKFTGRVTAATGPYVLDEVFVVYLKDGRAPNGGGDVILMKSYGFDLAAGCAAALGTEWIDRQSTIFSGDVIVRIR